MKRLEPFQHLRPRNTGDRAPLEPWQNIVLVVIQVDCERARFPMPPVIGEHLVGDRLEGDISAGCAGTLSRPFLRPGQQGSRLRPGLGFGHGVGIADLCPAALSFVLRLQEVAFLARRQGPDPEAFKVGIADVVGGGSVALDGRHDDWFRGRFRMVFSPVSSCNRGRFSVRAPTKNQRKNGVKWLVLLGF